MTELRVQFSKLRVLPVAALALIASLSAASASQNDFQTWSNLTYQGHLSEHWLGWAEIQGRFGENASRLSQLMIRPGLGYEIRPGLSVWGGYGRVETITAASQIGENRVWQQLMWSVPGKLFDGAFTSRTRFEERFVANGNSTGYRLREFIRYERPFADSGGLSFVATNEIFVAFNNTDWGARKGFDQNRAFIGIGMPAFENARLEVGYLNQYIDRPGPNDRINHILSISLLGRF